MAEKLRDGISRELRYVEYRLRKRKSDKNKKKGNSPTIDSSSSSLPSEFKDVAPSNPGEEDLQLQVALAVSREEAKEKEKSEMSDKVRLEMALKESAEVVAKVMAKHSPTHSAANAVGKVSVAADPWGDASQKQNAFDPFSDTKQSSSENFGGDSWKVDINNQLSQGQSSNQPQADPWSTPTNASQISGIANSQKTSSNQFSDPWGTQATANAAPVQAVNDPWGSGNQPVTVSASNNDPWGVSSNSIQGLGLSANSGNTLGNNLDLFAVQSNSSAQSLDSLKAFDQLTVQAQPTAPSSSLDVFSDVLAPQPLNSFQGNDSSSANVGSGSGDASNNNAGTFLGDNANLVNIDSLVGKPASSHPFVIQNSLSGGINSGRNPFNQKGPSPSLNQMKTGNQNPFAAPSSVNSSAVSGSNSFLPTPVNLPPMSGTMTGQPNYGITSGVPQNQFNPLFAPSQSSAPSQQQNQLLF